SLRVRLAVLMHCRWHRLIEERQFVILDVDNLKLRVLAVFQDIVHPLCNGRGFPSRSRTADDDSNFPLVPLFPSSAVPKSIRRLAQLPYHFVARSLLLLIFACCFSSFSAASSPSFLSDPSVCFFSRSDSADMSASRSFACRSKHDVASRLPSAVSSTTRSRRSRGLDLRTTNPRFSRRSTAAVIEPLARRTLS